jgi:hypothetical protein
VLAENVALGLGVGVSDPVDVKRRVVDDDRVAGEFPGRGVGRRFEFLRPQVAPLRLHRQVRVVLGVCVGERREVGQTVDRANRVEPRAFRGTQPGAGSGTGVWIERHQLPLGPDG